MARLRSGHL